MELLVYLQKIVHNFTLPVVNFVVLAFNKPLFMFSYYTEQHKIVFSYLIYLLNCVFIFL